MTTANHSPTTTLAQHSRSFNVMLTQCLLWQQISIALPRFAWHDSMMLVPLLCHNTMTLCERWYVKSYQVENTIGVTRELGYLDQWWVFPQEDLVLWIAVCAHLQMKRKVWNHCLWKTTGTLLGERQGLALKVELFTSLWWRGLKTV